MDVYFSHWDVDVKRSNHVIPILVVNGVFLTADEARIAHVEIPKIPSYSHWVVNKLMISKMKQGHIIRCRCHPPKETGLDILLGLFNRENAAVEGIVERFGSSVNYLRGWKNDPATRAQVERSSEGG